MLDNKIFVSYRRQDASGEAGRLVDHLQEVFGEQSVFLDVETIEAGIDFEDAINKALNSCKVLLAIIGPHWLSIKDDQGNPRLFKDHDFIRIEISAALERNIRVIPVLVNGAKMPLASELPGDLQGLTRRHAHELSSSRWKYDCDQLTELLLKLIPTKQNPLPLPPKPGTAIPVKPKKSWLAKNYLWVLGIFVALLLFGLIPDEDASDTYVDDATIENEDITDDYDEESNANLSVTPQVPEQEKTQNPSEELSATVPYDYSGKWWLWENGVRSGYLIIHSASNTFKFDYYYFNTKTGQGTGEYDGTEIYSTSFQLYDNPGNYSFVFGSYDGGITWEGYTHANNITTNAALVRD